MYMHVSRSSSSQGWASSVWLLCVRMCFVRLLLCAGMCWGKGGKGGGFFLFFLWLIHIYLPTTNYYPFYGHYKLFVIFSPGLSLCRWPLRLHLATLTQLCGSTSLHKLCLREFVTWWLTDWPPQERSGAVTSPCTTVGREYTSNSLDVYKYTTYVYIYSVRVYNTKHNVCMHGMSVCVCMCAQ